MIAPLSVVASWKRDAELFFGHDKICVHVHHGNYEERSQRFKSWRRNTVNLTKSRVHVLLTTYEMAIRDIAILKNISSRRQASVNSTNIGWYYMVVRTSFIDFIDFSINTVI